MVIRIATNNLIILVAFVPFVKFLLGVSNVIVPWGTLILSVVLFVLVPLVFGIYTRLHVVKKKGLDYFENTFLPKFDGSTIVGLILMLILLFSFQGPTILNNPLHILLIAVPLTIQTLFTFIISFGTSKVLNLPFEISAPAGMIGSSNFFELSVAVAISLFGMGSPAALATKVGVLTEVPIMLMFVAIANKTKSYFKKEAIYVN